MQLERGLRIVDSPGVVFDDDSVDSDKGARKSSVLLRNVVKVDDVEDPVAVGENQRLLGLVMGWVLIEYRSRGDFLSD